MVTFSDPPPKDILSPPDAAAVDALLDPSAPSLTPPDPARQARASQWLALLRCAPKPQPAKGLTARTLLAVQQDVDSRSIIRRPIEEIRSRGLRFNRHLAEIAALAIAASLLLAVLLPGLGHARQSAQRAACASNLFTLSDSISTYAASYSSDLPNLGVSPDGSWLPHDPTRLAPKHNLPHSNTANLLALVQDGLPPTKLVCPARDNAPIAFDAEHSDIPDAVRGYSYINLFGPARPTWDHQHTTIVLADRNPLFTNGSATSNAHLNSPNHGPNGTNVLAADGSVNWETSPDIGPDGDNIWTLGKNCNTRYIGTEVAASTKDIFLSP